MTGCTKLRVGIFSLALAVTTGCWSTPNDYWKGIDTSPGTDTETEELDGGDCIESDSDDCLDGGVSTSRGGEIGVH